MPEVGIVAFLAVHGLTSESWAIPGFAATLLFLAAARVDVAPERPVAG